MSRETRKAWRYGAPAAGLLGGVALAVSGSAGFGWTLIVLALAWLAYQADGSRGGRRGEGQRASRHLDGWPPASSDRRSERDDANLDVGRRQDGSPFP